MASTRSSNVTSLMLKYSLEIVTRFGFAQSNRACNCTHRLESHSTLREAFEMGSRNGPAMIRAW